MENGLWIFCKPAEPMDKFLTGDAADFIPTFSHYLSGHTMRVGRRAKYMFPATVFSMAFCAGAAHRMKTCHPRPSNLICGKANVATLRCLMTP
jgi:hypothetical protein